ncbi:hypothetical protein MBLNU459_g4776t2 [Dothideomycetes sp. NU459]
MATTNCVTEKLDFDFIIVGGGTAGCVVSSRLSEDPSVEVLLLEAGQDRNSDPRIITPGLTHQLIDNDEFDWRYKSEPQAGLGGRVMSHPRGKVLGGSSAINSHALIYPSVAGVDAWADLGNKGWEWSNFAPYFRRFQTINQPDEHSNNRVDQKYLHQNSEASTGPIQASYPREVEERHKAWVEAFEELGLASNTDPLEGNAVGGHISTCHISNDKRERSHAGKAYFDLATSRPNFHFVPDATVEKIVFDQSDSDTKRATGVSYTSNENNGKKLLVTCRKEVILAAGAFASPQILELSGIGSPERLLKYGVKVLVNNPAVGENLQDHIRCAISFEAKKKKEDEFVQELASAQREYDDSRRGPLAGACFTFAYLPLAQIISQEELTFLRASLDDYSAASSKLSSFERQRNDFIRRMIESPNEATATGYMSNRPVCPADGNFVSFYAMLSHPLSRGSVHIASDSVSDKPTIDFKYYSEPLDALIHGYYFRFYEKLAQTPQLSKLLEPNGIRLPQDRDVKNNENAREFLEKYSSTNYHPCGTCSMMPEEMGGVVNERLRVHGTSNVRVVDASIMPIIPRGNIISTVYAVAEKAADMISEDLGVRRTS